MVIEVGLGGTWDSTNVVHGDVAVLTNVSYDHTDVLGPTLEGIAADKAGIIEPGSRVVVGETGAGAGRDRAPSTPTRSAPASVWVAGRDFGCASNQVAVGGRLVTLWTPGGRYEDVLVPLHGAHQGRNAAVALAAAEAFFGEPLAPDVVEEGFAAVRVPGRLEVLGRRPLLLVDGAHNVAGMAALGDALTEEFAVDGAVGRGGGHAVGPRPVGHAGAARGRGRAHRRGLRAGVAACDAASARWPRPDARSGWRCTRSPTSATRCAWRAGMVDADGLVVVAGSLYVVGTARADVLASCGAVGGRRALSGPAPASARPRERARTRVRGCVVSTSSWTAPLSS